MALPELAQSYRADTDTDRSVVQECLWNKSVLELQVECTEFYQHYHPESGQYSPRGNLRLGSYNIYRLSEQRQKRLDLTAAMIDSQWDLVALSEVQPNLSHQKLLNGYTAEAFSTQRLSRQDFQRAYFKPSYVLLLLELQKLDPSWGMIVSSYSQATDSELYAFLYRKRQVEPATSHYCQQSYPNGLGMEPGIAPNRQPVACPLRLTDFEKEHFAKVPLVGRFKSGNFETSLMALHLRFRADGEFDSRCVEECQQLNRIMFERMMSNLVDPDRITKIREAVKPHENWGRDKSRQNQRFFEAWTATRASLDVRNAENTNDIIIAGDFNLDYKTNSSWQAEMWNAMKNLIDGGEVLIREPTSIGEKNGLSMSYDHFILSTQQTTECDTEGAHSVNFLSSRLILANGLSLGREVYSYRNLLEIDHLTDLHLREFNGQLWVSRSGNVYEHNEYIHLPLESSTREFQIQNQRICSPEDYLGQVIPWMNYQDQMIAALGCKMFFNPNEYSAHMYALSDHIPISLTCRAH